MKKALLWTGVVLLLAAAAAVFASRSHRAMPDFEVYRVAGMRAAAGEGLYREEDGHWQFKYLPAFAVAIAPLARLAPAEARAVWLFLSAVLVVMLVNRSFELLPGRRRTACFLVGLTVLAMGKHYVRELGLGQSNVLLAVLVLAAVGRWQRGSEKAAGVLLAAATVVKPYGIIFLPCLAARRTWSGVGSFVAVLAGALILPAARYGWAGNVDQLRGWWGVVTTSTAPNLAGQDTISIAGMYAVWLGVGPAAAWLSAATALVLVLACAWAVVRGRRLESPAGYLDAALLLAVIPLLSPQGWDYMLLVATPAVMLLLDRLDEFRPAVRWLLFASLALAGLALWDVMGRDAYRALMMSRIVTVGALFEVALVIHLRARRAA